MTGNLRLQPKEVVQRFIEHGAGKNDAAVMDECLDANFVWHNPMPGAPPTREGAKMAIAGFKQAFPDYELTLVDSVQEDDKVASRIRFVGTNKGPVMGMAATGRKVDIEYWHLERVKDGKIVERWNIMDTMAFMQQLGVGR